MTKKNCVLLFARPPIKGKVKTRLARTTGDDLALEIYQTLLHKSLDLLSTVPAECTIFLSEKGMESYDGFDGFQIEFQNGNNLGERMENALNWALKNRFDNVVLIGSDCFDLSTDIIKQAFLELEQYPIVIGPALDGGYYLIGTNKLNINIFDNIDWGSDKVFIQTKEKIIKNKLKCGTLPVLSDIDTIEDVKKNKKLKALLPVWEENIGNEECRSRK